jgi:hypothetical protein
MKIRSAAGGIDNAIIVLSSQAGSLSDIDDTWLNNKVRVTGTVGKLSVMEIEREIGWAESRVSLRALGSRRSSVADCPTRNRMTARQVPVTHPSRPTMRPEPRERRLSRCALNCGRESPLT